MLTDLLQKLLLQDKRLEFDGARLAFTDVHGPFNGWEMNGILKYVRMACYMAVTSTSTSSSLQNSQGSHTFNHIGHDAIDRNKDEHF